MRTFTGWLLESVGRFLPDEIEQKIQELMPAIMAAVPRVLQSGQPETVGQFMGRRSNATDGAVKRFLRKFVVVNEPAKKGLAWDNDHLNSVSVNAPLVADKGQEEVYHTIVHELIHSTDPMSGNYSKPLKFQDEDDNNFGVNNDQDRIDYMSMRHEFDAFLAMITNWAVRHATPEQAQQMVRGLAAGDYSAMPPPLQKRAKFMLKLSQPLKHKFLSRVYQAVQHRVGGAPVRSAVPLTRADHATGSQPTQYAGPAYVPKTTQ